MLKITSLFSLISTLIGVVSFFTSENEPIVDEKFTLYVNPYGNDKDSFDTIKWYKTNEEYSLYLPSDIDRSSLTVYFDGAESIKVNNFYLCSGDTTNAFEKFDDYKICVDKDSYKLHIFESANISAMFLETEKPMEYLHEDKENKSAAKIRTYENGEMSLDSKLKHIKGRGNSSWNYDKKSYNIKFDKKTDLLGMGKAKKWSLIAGFPDPVQIKNAIGSELSKLFGLNFTPDYNFVDLYINKEYYGNYLVVDPVEIGNNRIDIFDLSKATEDANDGADLESFPSKSKYSSDSPAMIKWSDIPNNPEDISGGYIIECDYPGRGGEEPCSFITTRNQEVVIKSPEFATKKQVEYISQYFQDIEDALANSTGFNKYNKHFSEYFDMESLVNYYILLELSENSDGGISSTFFYKDLNGKLCSGPIWDNDSAFGNIGIISNILVTDPSQWVINKGNYIFNRTCDEGSDFPTIFNRLFKHEYFRNKVNQRWAELRHIFTKQKVTQIINNIYKKITNSLVMNGSRWYGVTDKTIFDFITNITTENLKTRIEYLDIGFSNKAAFLNYDLNGGKGVVEERNILKKGELATVSGPFTSSFRSIKDVEDVLHLNETVLLPVVPPTEDVVFIGWNTKANGHGKWYFPGSKILLTDSTTLYAQWGKPSIFTPDYSEPNISDAPILGFLGSFINVLQMLLEY